MAQKLTDRALLATLASNDVLHIVDVSDNTNDPAGSSFKCTVGQLRDFFNTPLTPPETPNSALKVFTVVAQPKFVVANGLTFFENFGYTFNAGQIIFNADVTPEEGYPIRYLI